MLSHEHDSTKAVKTCVMCLHFTSHNLAAITDVCTPTHRFQCNFKIAISLLQRFFDVVLPSIGTPLSDHYGVKVRLYNIRNECSALQQCRYNCASEIKELSPFEPNFNEVCFS